MADPIAQREQEEVDLILAAMQPGATPEQIRAATAILEKQKRKPEDSPPLSLEDRTDPSQAARRAMEAHSTAPSAQQSQPSRFPRPDKIREGAAPPAQAMPPVKIGQ